LNEERDIKTEAYILSDGRSEVAGAHFCLHKAKGCPVKIAEIRNGVLFKGEPQYAEMLHILAFFEQWARDHKAGFLRFTPWLPVQIGGSVTLYSELLAKLSYQRGLQPQTSGRYTYWIDLICSDAEIMSRMKKQTRYDVRNALKSPLRIIEHDKVDDDIFNDFWKLYSSLADLKNFEKLSKTDLRRQLFALIQGGMAILVFIYFNDLLVNVSAVSIVGQAAYLYGAMDPQSKALPECPALGAAAQWAMISAAKKKGLAIYDLGFCPGPVPQQGHSRYNVWRFKYGFGGESVRFASIYGKILHPLWGTIYQKARYGIAKGRN
jgi:lipid II:glycine glycyltransferase (peptidoglycan interpeptide bridge formation enzyme)